MKISCLSFLVALAVIGIALGQLFIGGGGGQDGGFGGGIFGIIIFLFVFIILIRILFPTVTPTTAAPMMMMNGDK